VTNKASAAFFALTVMAGLLPRQGSSAEIKSIGDGDGRITIVITGKITPGDTDAFAAEVKQANDAKKIVANVSLNSVGGNLLEGVKLAAAVRVGKISTNVEKTCLCVFSGFCGRQHEGCKLCRADWGARCVRQKRR